MAFWRGETLLARLPALITPAFNPNNVDCAAYTLTLGSEVFVTSDLPEVGGPYDGVKTVLKPGQQLRVTPGQFGFLVSKETVEVPDSAIAFISMKASYKLRGLINVSGFHVDPGWKAPLLFAVYNAGPSPVCLDEGMPLFLIWYADLDQPTKKLYAGKGKAIDANLISNISGEVFSPIRLQKEVDRLQERLSEARESVIKVDASIKSVSTIAFRVALTAIVAFGSAIGVLFSQVFDSKLQIAALKAMVAAARPAASLGVPTTSSPQALPLQSNSNADSSSSTKPAKPRTPDKGKP